ncbi:MAG: family N-acetyltransferase [Proteobacteria bacterium]|nr:family N-acetyltransferase [Pseudomonadota bacterium]
MSENTIDQIRVRSRRYVAEVARDHDGIRASQALRYRVFAEEMGAHLHSLAEGLDYDHIDDYCDHLLVRETGTGRVVACTRLLSDTQAAKLGHFYSEGEFRLENVLALPGRFLEIGRTCVDPAHRGSVVLGTLWNGLAEYVYRGGFNYLMGCASISPGPNGFAVDAVYRQIEAHQFGPAHLAVAPLKSVPAWRRCVTDESGIPPLLQAYLRLGCWVCGEPFWDEDFNVMDVFILLDLTRLHDRYEKRFIATKAAESYAERPPC